MATADWRRQLRGVAVLTALVLIISPRLSRVARSTWCVPRAAGRPAALVSRAAVDVAEADAALAGEAEFDDGAEWGRRMRVQDLEVGQELVGIVQSIRPYGVFVDVGADCDGLVHISRLSDGFVESIDALVQPGQEVKVWVSSVGEDGKLGLSMVQSRVTSNSPGPRAPPNLEAFKGVSPDEWLDGTAVGIVDFGVFVELEQPGRAGDPVQGLVHITQLSEAFVERPADVVDLGQQVRVRVINVDAFSGRLSLSMKEPSVAEGPRRASQDVSGFEGISPDQWLTGRVHHTATFGIFVEVAPPDGSDAVQGLVHVTQIKEAFVDDPAAEVEVGQEVQVRVVSVDTYTGRLALSMRQVPSE